MKRAFPSYRIARGAMIAPFMGAPSQTSEKDERPVTGTKAEPLTQQDRLALERAENEGMAIGSDRIG